MTLSVLIVVISLMLLGFSSWSTPFFNRYVQSYELDSARKKIMEARVAVDNYPRGSAHIARSWSAWGEQYDFTLPRDVRWEQNFAVPLSMRAFDVSALVILDQKARVRSAIYLDKEGEPTALPAAIRSQFQLDSPLLKSLKKARGLFFRQNNQLWVLGACRIDKRGIVIVGQRVMPVQIRGTLKEMKSKAKVWLPDQAPPPAIVLLRNSPSQVSLSRGVAHQIILDSSADRVVGYELVRSAEGTPLFILEAPGELAPERSLLVFLPLLLLILGALMLLFGLVPGEIYRYRLGRLGRYLEAVQQNGEAPPLPLSGRDEWSAFSAGVNRALGALDEATRRHRQGEAMQLQMAQLALGAGDAFWVWKVGADFLEWHGDVDGMMGHGAGGMKRTFAAWMNHIHSADQNKVRRACTRPLRAGETIEIDFRVIRYDGETRVWSLRGRLLQRIFNSDDSAPRLLAVCSDITERRMDEEELRSSRQSLQRIFETAADAFLVVDTEGQITFANAAAERIFALDRAGIEQRSFFDKRWNMTDLQGQSFANNQHPFYLLRASGESLNSFEFRFDRADGRPIIASLNAAPLLDNRGAFSGVVVSVADITERRMLEDRLKHQAFHDPLTHLANRVLVRYRLEEALQQCVETDDCTQNQQNIAIIFIDLDNFKYINDSLGHSAGDQLLIDLADRLRASLREDDMAARFGGDEFVILLENLESPDYAVSVAERVLEAMREPFLIEGHEVFATPSIGIAFSDENLRHADELLRHADAAMYEAKRRGKACFAIYESSMSGDALKRLELENDLRRALQNGDFSLYFQPTWDLNSNRVSGFEALVRWNHAIHGSILPNEFVPVAEETGLIVPLGFQVLDAACRQAVAWNRSSAHPLSMSVNIAARQLHFPEVVPLVARALEQSGLEPQLLILEITESAIVERTEQVLITMNELKKLGVSLAIDDFGTGYSSLAYLRAFPFDYLKIDRQFVSCIDREPDNSAIVASMVTLAHALKLIVVAEGAETDAEIERLKSLGCDKSQGYFFGRPQSASFIEFDFDLQSAPEDALVLPITAPRPMLPADNVNS